MKKSYPFFCILVFSLCWFPHTSAQSIAAWYGEWKGSLELFKADGAVDKAIPMELLIQPTKDSMDTRWRITYNNKEVREYILRAKDTLKGEYALVETNGINIELRKFGKIMMSNFEVMDYQINNTYELTGMSIWYTLVSSTSKLHSQSGKGTHSVPIVKSVPPNVYQRAVLMRQ